MRLPWVVSTGAPEGRGAERPRTAGNLHSHYDNKPVKERLHFHYDQSGNLIAESDVRGDFIREYIYLGNYRVAMTAVRLDTPAIQPDGRRTGADRGHVISTRASAGRGAEKSAVHRSLALYFIHNDHLGTPHKVTNAEQQIVWSMEQTPFGEVSLLAEGIRMPMRFPGQYSDGESTLSYNYYRDYDPTIGRYIQSDPIGLRGGVGLFLYVSDQVSTS